MSDSTESKYDYNIRLFFDEEANRWGIDVESDDPNFMDQGNAVGDTPEEALQLLAAEWESLTED